MGEKKEAERVCKDVLKYDLQYFAYLNSLSPERQRTYVRTAYYLFRGLISNLQVLNMAESKDMKHYEAEYQKLLDTPAGTSVANLYMEQMQDYDE